MSLLTTVVEKHLATIHRHVGETMMSHRHRLQRAEARLIASMRFPYVRVKYVTSGISDDGVAYSVDRHEYEPHPLYAAAELEELRKVRSRRFVGDRDAV